MKWTDLKRGDTVFHLLHGREWLGLIMLLDKKEKIRDSRGLIHMVPGSEYQYFFETNYRRSRDRVTLRRGWVYLHWLRKAEKI